MTEILPTELSDVKIIQPRRFHDTRGFFSETWNAKGWAAHGIDADFVQDNQSMSHQIGTVRGLHFQAPPHAQGKLVRCARGRLLDVVVDLRKGSPDYGRWCAVELSFENGRQLWVPPGFAHGFVTREADTEIAYKCTGYYAPGSEGSLNWADPDLGITWGIDTDQAVLSDKDAKAPAFATFESPFTYEKSVAP